MTMKNLILLLSLSFFALSCSKEDGDGKGGDKGKFWGKSREEVIQTKYEYLMLGCELKTQAFDQSVSRDLGVQEYRFGLMENPFQPKTFELNASIPGHDIKATVHVSDLKIMDYFELQLSNGTIMVAESSPAAEIQISLSWITRFTDGTISDGGGQSRRLITEGPGDQILNREENRGIGVQRIVDSLKCRIVGQIRPEYQDQLRYK